MNIFYTYGVPKSTILRRENMTLTIPMTAHIGRRKTWKTIVIPIKNYTYRNYAVRFVVAIKGANSDCDRNPFIARHL